MWPFTSSDKNDVIKNALKKAKKSGKPEPIEGKDNHFMWKNGIEAVKQPNGRYKILKNHNKDIKAAMAKLRAKASAARKAKATGRKESKAKAAEKVLKACVEDCKKQYGGDGSHKNFGKALNTRYLQALVKKAHKVILEEHPNADLECPTNIRRARRMANKMAKDDFAKKHSSVVSRKSSKVRAEIRKNDKLLTEGDVEGFDDGSRKTVPQFKKKVNKPKRAKKSKN